MSVRLTITCAGALLAFCAPIRAAVTFATFHAGPNVLESDATSAEDGDEVATWLDSSGGGNHATAPVGQRPVFAANYLGTGSQAVVNTADHITLSSAFITGNEGFTIKGRAWVYDNSAEHVYVNNWHQTANTSGIEFRQFGGRIGIYIGYANSSVEVLQQVFPAIAPGGEFINIFASRVGNFYTVAWDLNKDGDFNDIVSGVSESATGTVGSPTDIIGSGHNLELGNIYYGSAPSVLASMQITVPEPAAAGVLVLVGTLGAARRQRRI